MEEDERKAFSKKLAIEEKAAKIFRHHMLEASWLRASKEETNKCESTFTDKSDSAKETGIVHGGGITQGQRQKLRDNNKSVIASVARRSKGQLEHRKLKATPPGSQAQAAQLKSHQRDLSMDQSKAEHGSTN